MHRTTLVPLLALFTLACSKPTEQPSDSSSTAPQAPTDEPSTPTGPAVGEGAVVDGPCWRVGKQPWQCLDADHPLLRNPDAITAKGRKSGLMCLGFEDGRLVCHRGDQSFSGTRVDDFEVGGTNVIIARLGVRRKVATFERELSEIQIDAQVEAEGQFVEIAFNEACGRIRNGVMRCLDERLTDVQEFCMGRDHFCARVGTQVICGGKNRDGQFGLGHRNFVDALTPVTMPPAVAVDCTQLGACALTETGEVWCWGGDQSGVLGRPAWASRDDVGPQPVPGLGTVVGFGIPGSSYGCGVQASGELRCWGDAPEGLAKVGDAAGCLPDTPEAWAKTLEAAAPNTPTAQLIAQLGVKDEMLRQPTAGDYTLESVTVHTAELDGTAPAERVIEARLDVSGEARMVISVMRQQSKSGAEDRWCSVDNSLSLVQPVNRSPAQDWPTRPGFRRPAELAFVELVAPGRQAIELIQSGGYAGQDSYYGLGYYELRGDALVGLFEAFTLYSNTEPDAYDHEPTITGSIELSGEFPKLIETTTTTDCARVKRGCKAGTVKRTWTFDGERYE